MVDLRGTISVSGYVILPGSHLYEVMASCFSMERIQKNHLLNSIIIGVWVCLFDILRKLLWLDYTHFNIIFILKVIEHH